MWDLLGVEDDHLVVDFPRGDLGGPADFPMVIGILMASILGLYEI